MTGGEGPGHDQGGAISPQTCLGFDYGTKRIGVAVGQALTGTARPLDTLISKQGKPDWDSISALINEWQPDALVLGLPVNADGTQHEITKAAQRFGNQLNGRYNLPVYMMDERLSSSEAEQLLADNDKSYSKPDVDMMAASLILESWFAEQH